VGGGPGPRVRRTPRWLREIGLIAVIYLGYEASRGLQNGQFSVATTNGWHFLRLEQAWHIAPEHVLTSALTHLTPLAVAASYFYSTMHYIVTPIVLVWLYRRHSDRYRFARTALAISTIIGLIGYYAVPTAPPRLLTGAHVPDILSDVQEYGWWGGDGSVPSGLGGLSNQFAAMPSMHVGWALWCGVLIYRYASRAWVRWLGVAYPVVTTVVVLSTGNHYLLDAFAGAAVMGVGTAITASLSRAGRRSWLPALRTEAGAVYLAEPITPSPRAWPLLMPFFGAFSPSVYSLFRSSEPAEAPLPMRMPESVCSVGVGPSAGE
jgi:hypothetical protein